MTDNQFFNLTLSKEPNALDGITCYEPVDATSGSIFFEKIMKSALLQLPPADWNERKLLPEVLSKYKAFINREINIAEVKYGGVPILIESWECS